MTGPAGEMTRAGLLLGLGGYREGDGGCFGGLVDQGAEVRGHGDVVAGAVAAGAHVVLGVLAAAGHVRHVRMIPCPGVSGQCDTR